MYSLRLRKSWTKKIGNTMSKGNPGLELIDYNQI